MKPKRSEIWTVNLDPTLGAEIRKTRPVIVVSSDSIGVLPLRLVAPITEWKDHYNQNIWHVKLIPDSVNGLTKISAVDTFQVRSVDTIRFIQKIGSVSPDLMKSIVTSIAVLVEY